MKKKPFVMSGFRIRVSEDVYGDDIVLCLNTAKKYEEYLLKQYKVEEHIDKKAKGHVIVLDNSGGGFDYSIWMPSFDWTIDNQTTLAHELIHVATGILSRRGIDIDEGRHEALAYLYGHLFWKLWNALKRGYRKG